MNDTQKIMDLEFELMAVVNYLLEEDYTTDKYEQALIKGMELKKQLELLQGESK